MRTPCIKGTAFRSVVQDIQRLRECGRIPQQVLEKHLDSDDIEALEEVITAISWYPIERYRRCMELLAEVEARGNSTEYFTQRGYRAAEALFGGTYHAYAAEAGSWGPRAARSLINLSKAIYNFTEWRFEVRDGGATVLWSEDAADFPDAARYAAEGFLRFFASRASGGPAVVESERPAPHRLVFRISSGG